jgi:1-pyrroline-5-carboxylate dehydrogenase
MTSGLVFTATNEPILSYAPNSAERAALARELKAQQSHIKELPLVIGGHRVPTTQQIDVVQPHRHGDLIATLSQAQPLHISQAIEAASAAHKEWSNWSFEDRAKVFLKAADLLAGPWRQRMNAATMLGQSKTCYQAEIDSACELIDFLRFNVAFAEQLYHGQPLCSPGVRNELNYRPLEGFVYAVTPFNFTAIGGNLAAAPALMGNTIIWKPSSTASLSNYLVLELLEEAGLPPGVINFLPGDAQAISQQLIAHEDFAGLHFTGSTAVFDHLWRATSENLSNYQSYPRLVGETGGKDFVLAHPSANVDALATALVRGAFEYQGQKCSAASRAYIPRSLWPAVRDRLIADIESIRIGDVADFGNFMGAVIDEKAFQRVSSYIQQAKDSDSARVLVGGVCDDSVGYFVTPTLIEVNDPDFVTMREEIFGPVLSVYVYEDNAWVQTLGLVDATSPYALTGAVFAHDRSAIISAKDALRYSAGNFYINDKPTGAVVGQQPFGGSRRSGTNDKAGSLLNLIRWTSPQTIKETMVPPVRYEYPHMQ